ncbi:MAG: M48 family metalloprotease [Firmicutes bacterium]|nr:M48 family metalloprotease [Bacillota bacterium]
MRCPNCSDKDLQPVLTRQGVEVEFCESCHGVWLDRGEIYCFSREPEEVADKLSKASKNSGPRTKCSPKNGDPMTEISYPGGAKLHACGSGGLWLDAGDLKQLIDTEKNIEFDLDTGSISVGKTPMLGAIASSVLLGLPNLFFRSAITLIGLYLLLGIVLITIVALDVLNVEFAVATGIAVVIIQFILGPWSMDLSLFLMFKMNWLTPDKLPTHLREFVDRVCQEKGIPFPRFGIIDDGAPQAFTYGHTPKNARIVISRGILDLLEPAEVEAVVAHEIGHAVHWDMFLMTVVQLVPLILYYIYSTFSGFRDDRGKNYTLIIAIGSYVLYFISEYLVLAFSRTREYYADRFSGEVTGDPTLLASALVKIAYGLAGREKPKEEEEEERQARKPYLKAVSAMGIFDSNAALALAVSSYQVDVHRGGQANIKSAMRWDLWNPWAKWYELNSTHPLVANRLNYLSNQSISMGKAPYIEFDDAQPESYWDEFFLDLLIYLAPLLPLALLLLILGISVLNLVPNYDWGFVVPLLITALGAGFLLRYYFSYRRRSFPEMSVASLLRHVKVSNVRPVPCTLRGKIIGRGVPGYIFSEDFVMQDESGIIFLDLRQPLGIWEALFAIIKAGAFQGKEVVVRGWYRRAPVPYVELLTISHAGGEVKSLIPFVKKAGACLLVITGLILSFNTILYGDKTFQNPLAFIEEKSPVYSASGYKVYSDSDYKFKINCPPEWRRTARILVTFQKSVDDREPAEVNVSVKSSWGHTLDETTQSIIKNRKKDYNNLIIEVSESTLLSGGPAYQLIYTFTAYSDKKDYKSKEVWTVKNKKLYCLNYTAEQDLFNDYLKEADTIINSFEFIQ